MPDYPDLYLMRHGQTVWNAEGRMQGRMNSNLTDLGTAQAHAQSRLVSGIEAARYASPQGRARQTAQIVFDGQPYQEDERLCEIDIGGFSGQRYEDIKAQNAQLFAGSQFGWYDGAPQGEGFDSLRARCRSFLDDLTGPALIVTHGITLRMMRVVALGLPMERFAEMAQFQGAVQVIRNGQHEIWQEDESLRLATLDGNS
ncbi:histidine phosphatase family protein [Paracoccus tegillarcae]|uniref:Histidine phosphatase family protein n=1 Tax=Paracoccus tegillarcae TaxID=1529068 RepID=A0A2K9EL13_9RHOB|nr:histidine phosphatase family protein [Paracoccus tegillarcae]AUH32285.1 histidine phosphatase family protein [Paracoccus tegillarcae]